MTDTFNPLPLTIISGFLGAGKTTLVNHLLRHAGGRRLVVLVNDFGELPIDADLIESRDGDTLNLANGCACCSMGGDFFNALVDVLDRSPKPDHILIEASGVADPARIANIARAEPDLSLDAIISLADAENIAALINDPQVGETVCQQLKTSDILLLNKLDLINEQELIRLVKQLQLIAPDVRIIETVNSGIPLEMAIGLNIAEKSRIEEQHTNGDHGERYSKWSRVTDNRLDRPTLEKALGNLDHHILRLKGIVYFTNSDTAHVVQCVGTRCTIARLQRPVTNNRTKSRLVAIGLAGQPGLNALDGIFRQFI